MTRLGRFLVVAVVVAAWFPASALASVACTVVSDPSGDPSGVLGLYGFLPSDVTGRAPAEIDVTRVVAGYDERGALVVGWRVADLAREDAAGIDDSYVMSWNTGPAYVSLTAARTDGRWSYLRTVSRSGTDGVHGPVTGDVDPVADVVTMRIPAGDAAYVTPGRRMNDVSAWTMRAEKIGVFSHGTWSDSTDLRDARLRSDCSAPASAVVLCSVLSDAAGDVGTSEGPQDPSVDIRSVALGATGETLTIRVVVRELAASVPENVDSQYWSVGWTIDQGSYGVTAERWRNGPATFSFSGPTGGDQATGSFDAATRAITIDVDREALGVPDRTAMTDVNAWSGSSSHAGVASTSSQYDMAYDDVRARYTLGLPCGTDVPVCPPVADAAGDAGPIFSSNGTDVPRNEPSLDVRTVGATSDDDVIRVSARVDDASASLSPGWDTAGWTMSWTRDATHRIFVQAVRGPSGLRFTYGVDPSNGDGYVSGPTFGGRRTRGSITGDVITVEIPRRATGDPADGTSLEWFGASSWVLRSGTSAATYRVVDETQHGWYVVGSACGP